MAFGAFISHVHLRKSPEKTFGERGGTFKDDWTNTLSIAFKMDRSDFFLFWPVGDSPKLPIGEMRCAVGFN